MDIWLELAKQGVLAGVIAALLFLKHAQEARDARTMDALYQAQVDIKEIVRSELQHTCELIQAKLDAWRAGNGGGK
ncbi:MAG TPA: hypothetical protein PK406_00550 [Verrucomicrobiota bacterium]|nr:hypothetical protein [Verrucomicrobiota bacterium]